MEKIDSSKSLVKSNDVLVIAPTKGPNVSSATDSVEFDILQVEGMAEPFWTRNQGGKAHL